MEFAPRDSFFEDAYDEETAPLPAEPELVARVVEKLHALGSEISELRRSATGE